MLLTIKTAAEQAGLSPGTLRAYERAGLIRPQRDSAGRRVFTPTDVIELRRIAAARRASRTSGLGRLYHAEAPA
jgi:DNA-binding transcriptional MerR regulator